MLFISNKYFVWAKRKNNIIKVKEKKERKKSVGGWVTAAAYKKL